MDERAYARYMADVTYFLSLLEENPNSKYFMPVALAYNKMEKYDETISVCKKALERFPSYCPIKTLLAEAYIYKGDPQSAKKLLFDVITEDPNNYKAMKLLGMIYHSSDETGEALKYFKAAYIRAPEDEELKRLIEELGASVSPEDLFDEYMKKHKDPAWGGEDKSYKDIERHIRSAEVMMADLVADTAIMEGGEEAAPKSIDTNSISEEDLAKLLSGENGVSGKDTSLSSSRAPSENNTVSDAELEKLLSASVEVSGVADKADLEAGTDNKVSDGELEKLLAEDSSDGGSAFDTAAMFVSSGHEAPVNLEERENIDDIIEKSDDYSELSSILDSQAEAESAGDAGGSIADPAGTAEAADVLAALDGAEETVAEVTEEGVSAVTEAEDVLAALESEDEALAGRENEGFYDLKESGFSLGAEDEGDVSSDFYTSEETSKTILGKDSFKAFENDTPEEELFVLDEDSLNTPRDSEDRPAFSSFQKSDKGNAPATEERSGEGVFVFHGSGKSSSETISRDNNSGHIETFEDRKGEFFVESPALEGQSEKTSSSFASEGIKTDESYKEPGTVSFPGEDLAKGKTGGNHNAGNKALVEPLEFRLEDMIGDDDENMRAIPEEDIPSMALGEAAPFTQKDILDEIFAASEEALPAGEGKPYETPFSNEDDESREKAKARLMKLQARLEKLKKG